ncbi:hypothetical protein KDX08_14985 [Burkholderia cenocepacia]|uniref:hypothetical protein n=1 Tax=Burkholderia cenocepacia TaxID=95486 RepID=UPI0012AEC662|nr:hypothetical protein [Burkholderia cenocepacia]MBR7993747.1 hypothetical protein [Burkholderia cenocepacia]
MTEYRCDARTGTLSTAAHLVERHFWRAMARNFAVQMKFPSRNRAHGMLLADPNRYRRIARGSPRERIA